MNETVVLHQRRRRMAIARNEVSGMSDPEKIAKAVGIMEVSKAICINPSFQKEADKVATILQVATDAVLSVLKDDD